MNIWWRKCTKCDKEALIYDFKTDSKYDCKCKIKAYQKRNLEMELEKSGLPSHAYRNKLLLEYDLVVDYKGNSFKKSKVTTYRKEFKYKNNRNNLYFWGQPDTQKTITACWIGKELLKQKFKVKFISLASLIPLLTDFKLNANDYLYTDFLIIDKLKTKPYSFQLSSLETFLEQRLTQYHTATCFTSNLSIYELKTIFNISIESIIKRNVILAEFKDVVPPMDFEDFNWD
ncbi:hypothetical protein LCGC14_1299200 [marine sediment metagenome]|uniref:IstB-like ATP-binding domain-containing protein n=1 Tax=marine sediment metagenome TaxID=412755 RepID=A0A0F9NT23_9ZZZZ